MGDIKNPTLLYAKGGAGVVNDRFDTFSALTVSNRTNQTRWGGAVGAGLDWDALHDDFTARLAAAMGLAAEPAPWPELNEDEVSGLIEQYSAPEWIEYR